MGPWSRRPTKKTFPGPPGDAVSPARGSGVVPGLSDLALRGLGAGPPAGAGGVAGPAAERDADAVSQVSEDSRRGPEVGAVRRRAVGPESPGLPPLPGVRGGRAVPRRSNRGSQCGDHSRLAAGRGALDPGRPGGGAPAPEPGTGPRAPTTTEVAP